MSKSARKSAPAPKSVPFSKSDVGQAFELIGRSVVQNCCKVGKYAWNVPAEFEGRKLRLEVRIEVVEE